MFSLPLLYTMEVWWAGFSAHPWRLLAYVAATFVLLLGYNRYGGLRRDASMTEVAIDSVEELGIGLVLSAFVLFLLGRISIEMPAGEVMGRIVIEAMTVAVGVSVGTAQLGGAEDDEGLAEDKSQGSGAGGVRGAAGKKETAGQTSKREAQAKGQSKIHFGGQMVLAFCGAVLFAANVAPTEEIVMIAVELSWMRLLGLATLSLLLCVLILHYSEFTGARQFVRRDGALAIFVGTVITYSIALVCAGLILWFFGRFDGVTLYTALAQIVVLGVAASLGASAGRLLLQ